MVEPQPLIALELDQDRLEAWAAELAARLRVPLWIGLRGPLGAGKSTFARALLRALGVSGRIKSPTYGLLELYPLERGEAAHLDLYRIRDPRELDALALRELRAADRLVLVEWPERAGSALSLDGTIRLEYLDAAPDRRRIEARAYTRAGRDWLCGAPPNEGESSLKSSL